MPTGKCTMCGEPTLLHALPRERSASHLRADAQECDGASLGSRYSEIQRALDRTRMTTVQHRVNHKPFNGRSAIMYGYPFSAHCLSQVQIQIQTRPKRIWFAAVGPPPRNRFTSYICRGCQNILSTSSTSRLSPRIAGEGAMVGSSFSPSGRRTFRNPFTYPGANRASKNAAELRMDLKTTWRRAKFDSKATSTT